MGGIQYIPMKNAKFLLGSLRSINHKIDHLNLIIQILYLRNDLTNDEMKKIGSDLCGSPLAVCETLKDELPLAEKKLAEILEGYGYIE